MQVTRPRVRDVRKYLECPREARRVAGVKPCPPQHVGSSSATLPVRCRGGPGSTEGWKVGSTRWRGVGRSDSSGPAGAALGSLWHLTSGQLGRDSGCRSWSALEVAENPGEALEPGSPWCLHSVVAVHPLKAPADHFVPRAARLPRSLAQQPRNFTCHPRPSGPRRQAPPPMRPSPAPFQRPTTARAAARRRRNPMAEAPSQVPLTI